MSALKQYPWPVQQVCILIFILVPVVVKKKNLPTLFREWGGCEFSKLEKSPTPVWVGAGLG